MPPPPLISSVEVFIARWESAGGSERANYQLFLTELCELLGLPQPEQVRRVADVLAAARSPLGDDALAAHFTGRGPWKKRLPQIVETLVSLGRARRVTGGVIGAN